MKNIMLALLLLGSLDAFAQSPRTFGNNQNAWFMYFGDHKFSPKWGVHLEAQLRRSDGVKNGQQLLLRTGINYHFTPAAFATVGYCFVETYPYGEFPAKSTFPENRLWEQIQLKQAVGRVEVVSRFRLEQRYVKSPVSDGNGSFEPGPDVYSNRFRLLTRGSIPLKGKSIVDKSWYLTAYDEMFVSYGKKVALNIFDQNRAYVALGYRLPKIGRLELGYMTQLIFKGDGVKVERNHTLMFGLSSNIDFFKKS
jgi:hypothetical protein